MKKILLLFLMLVVMFSLASCNKTKDPITPTATPTEQIDPANYTLVDNVQDGLILHAWNWSYNTIKQNLKAIASSGYSTVQTSPVQQSKSNAKTGSWSKNWAMLYQPAAFAVAQDSFLGTKDELKSLCAEAEKYGVKIICDIVVNHMGNDETGAAGSYTDKIENYEPEIWANKETYFHQYTNGTSDSDAKSVTQYELSNLPDLNTSNEFVQSRVISLLKECIDCGVSGFRFDAAKHIETPDDGAVASNFWPNILTASTEYASTTYQRTMYYYGEVLNTPGSGRNWSSYTKYMSLTDTNYSSRITQGVSNKSAAKVIQGLDYTFGGNKAVAWVESHDTYASGSTTSIPVYKNNLNWAVLAARGESTSLYFARPSEDTAMGDCGSIDWKSPEVAAVNNFHNLMVGATENVVASASDKVVVIERTKATLAGAVAVDLATIRNSETRTITFNVTNLSDGIYYDQVTGNEFTVASGVATGEVGPSGIVVLLPTKPVLTPIISLADATGYYYSYYETTVTAKNATKIEYSINDAPALEVTNGGSIIVMGEVGENILKVTAYNGDVKVTETYKFYKLEQREGYLACAGLKDPTNYTVYAWVWSAGKDGKWIETEIVGDICYIPYDGTFTNYLIASFDKSVDYETLKGYGTKAWSYKLGQTSDTPANPMVVALSTI